ncbi:putative LRR receptor-like serine/threonine-protein kinase [Camellia lanceoleosa]|uniref:LRR receptor-like serine/threonine-protein kinase n=1 Tax=Camellia lanceoleosa TaxID=1840588 RepID=A0ACC0GZ82_9ERIC|nr:putative LRR receptor-like serine/threonine-protein kinase [Camellia lanceoleosa]
MMESIATASKLFCCFVFVSLVLNCFNDFQSDAELLPLEEVKALETISARLQIKNFTVNQSFCSSGRFIINYPDGVANVTCNCSATVCHVTNILLKGLDLPGILPEEFANLSNLQEIDLSRNYISGSIPKTFAKLSSLTILSLGGNRINGVIPKEIGDIATLEELVLEQNQLSGTLPEKLGNLSRLRRLVLSANNFTGRIPNTFSNLKNLTDFRIDGNVLSGKIPDLIGNWTKIEKMYMQGTSMDGPIPSTISQLKNMTELVISDLNGSTMEIPDLKGMINLKFLVLRNCLITGRIPPYIGDQLPKLKNLDLSFNMLTGEIPPTFLSLDIDYMFLTNNLLTGVVPDWIPNSKKSIDISYNDFSPLPSSYQFSCLSSAVNLISVNPPTNNSIDWCLQKGFPCSTKPKNHDLFINCGGEQTTFEGHVYEENKDRQGESYFFSSSEKWAYSSTGVFMGKNNASLVADNKFKLNLTDDNLYSTARLAPISLKYYGLCLRKGNYKVRLHFAEIMFSNDQKFSSLGRRIFDISIQGKVIWKDFNIMNETKVGVGITKTVDVDINGSTLEIHLYWSGKGTTTIPDKGTYGPLISAISVTPNYKLHTGLSAGAIAGIVVSSCVLLVLILVALRMKGYLGGKDLEDKELRALDLQTGYFSLRQIKAATSNFDLANKIGEGGFGPVYKGVLSDGAVIAVKQLSAKSKQGNREFVNEIGMISALQHPNLVRLYGCCIEGNQLLLIYEYMENNSLARALFGREEHCLKLDWPTRKRICVGIARGLAYLHEESRLKIVHRDIKATNVLLDKDLNAKISDFGLAKLDEEENTHISTRIAGTIGYMAPEYAMRGYLTDKADVYSFGIVALEIVTGKSNTNYRPREEFVYLLDWAYVLQEQGNLLSLVDSNLGPDYPKDEVMNMLSVALLCTNISPSLRPSMSSVVSMLEGQSPIQAPVIKRNSLNEDMRFKAFERLTQDSQTHVSTFSVDSQVQRSISMDGPWIDSSVSIPSINEVRDHSSSSKLLPDLYDVNLE